MDISFPLNLKLPTHKFSTVDFVANNKYKLELEKLNLKEKFEYYNKNIKSLTVGEKIEQVSFYCNEHDKEIIFCDCAKHKKEVNYSEKEAIYFEVRANEIERILDEINKKSNYRSKLKFLYSVKGYSINSELKVFDNSFRNHVIDLMPQTKEQIEIYNTVKLEAFDAENKNEHGFTENYNGFDFTKEKENLITHLQITDDKNLEINILNKIKTDIENEFKFSVHPKSNEDGKSKHEIELEAALKTIDDFDYGSNGNLFVKIFYEGEIDFYCKSISTNDIFEFTHYSEIVKFYKYVKGLIRGYENTDNSIGLDGLNPNKEISIKESGEIKPIEIKLPDDLVSAFNEIEDFEKANSYISNFFNGNDNTIESPIFVKSGNIKTLAFQLGEIWRSKENGTISYEYLLFYKSTFSIFKKQVIDRNNLFGTNLYKYSISKT
jgi:hypothetical protein